MKILLVDDDAMFLRFFRLHLQKSLRAEILTAATGLEAIRIIESEKPNLVVLDVEMPQHSGFQILETIRKRYSRLAMPVVMATGKSEEKDVLKGFELGANEYIFKPLEPAVAIARIKNVLLLHEEFLTTTGDFKAPTTIAKQEEPTATVAVVPNKPVPCEVPAVLIIDEQRLFCKTVRIGHGNLIMLAFENVPEAKKVAVQFVYPDGQTDTIDVEIVKREALKKQDLTAVKLLLKITKKTQNFQDFAAQLAKAYQDEGQDGVRRMMQKPDLPVGTIGATTGMAVAAKVIQGKRYHFERLLGRGGFAEVYLVKDLALKRLVALKALNPKLAEDFSARSKFLTEAQIAAQFHHPNIVFLYEVGEFSKEEAETSFDFPGEFFDKYKSRFIYFTMQYVQGPTLEQILRKKGPIDPETCLKIGRDVAGALEYAHGKGVIHRDIKPANIIVMEDHVVVTDFGIASIDPSVAQVGPASEIVRTVNPKLLECTPRYASPEQLLGKSLDGRSDIYGLGAVLYECLTGQAPFPQKDLKELYHAKMRGDYEPPNRLVQDLEEHWVDLLKRCLAFNPEDRIAGAEDLLKTFTEIYESQKEEEDTGTYNVETILNAIISAGPETDTIGLLIKLTAFIRIIRGTKSPETVNEITAAIADPTVLNTLLRRHLNPEELEHLRTFFHELECGRAEVTLLRWFEKEPDPSKQLLLARLAVVAGGKDLAPLTMFSLELPDNRAALMIQAFQKEGIALDESLLARWVKHPGRDTQMAILAILKRYKGSSRDRILDSYIANTNHTAVRRKAREIKAGLSA